MIRYYLADVIGDGAEDNPWRPSVVQHWNSWGWSLPSDENGAPLNSWGLVEVFNDPSPAVVDAMALDSSLDALPYAAPNVMLSGLDTSALRAALIRRGIGQDVLDNADTLGELVSNIEARAASPI